MPKLGDPAAKVYGPKALRDKRGDLGFDVKLEEGNPWPELEMISMAGAPQVDEVVLGGGNAKQLKELPEGARLGDNRNAFAGGFRLWKDPLAGKRSRTHVRK